MARKKFTAEQVIGLLRQAEVMVGRGCGMEEVLREIGVTANTYYRWRKEYGGLGLDQARLCTSRLRGRMHLIAAQVYRV